MWNGYHNAPSTVVQIFSVKLKLSMFCAFWPDGSGTEIGLYSLAEPGGAYARNEPVLIENWKQRDPSFTLAGMLPAHELIIKPPILRDDYIIDVLAEAGLSPAPSTIEAAGRRLAGMFVNRAIQYIARKDEGESYEFIIAHSTYIDGSSLVAFCQTVLDDLVAWKEQLIPHIQHIPLTCRIYYLVMIRAYGIEQDLSDLSAEKERAAAAHEPLSIWSGS
jgi:hypothetical protein